MARQRSAAVISIARSASVRRIFMRGQGRAEGGSSTDATASTAHGKRGRGGARATGCRQDAGRKGQLQGGSGWSMGFFLPSAAPTYPRLLRGQPQRSLAHIRSYHEREQEPGLFYFKNSNKVNFIQENPNAPIATPSLHWKDLALLLKNSGPLPFLKGCDAARTAQNTRSLGKAPLQEPALVRGHHRVILCEESQGACARSRGQSLTSVHTAAQTPAGGSQLLKLAPSLLWPCYHHMPSSGCPLTRGFSDLFREDKSQREGMGHGLQMLSVAQGWLPSIFSISTACTTTTHGLQRGQVLNTSCPKIHRAFASAGMTCGGQMARDAIDQEQLPLAFSTTSGQ